jgi:anthranilate synthase/aminodeoxychorismate synthase-like glutamine amidotransferase
MVLLIDNYDSFVYNLARYVRELGEEPLVRRHDALTVEDVLDLAPSHVIISPGPCSPAEAGISTETVRRVGATIPVLGVCLGHQCLGAVYGGMVQRAPRLMHGKTSRIHHHGTGLFANIPSPFEATRYHSLIVAEPVPASLEVTAFTTEGEVMGLRHREHPTFGVQFHPESILTPCGRLILENFVRLEPGVRQESAAARDPFEPATGRYA